MDGQFNDALGLFAAHDWEGCAAALARIQPQESNRLDIAYLLGLCNTRLKKWDEALLYLEQVVTAPGDTDRISQCRLTLAYIYSITGRAKLAAYELDAIIKEGSPSVPVLATRGFAAWADGDAESAERYYSEAVAIDPENANALNGLGYILACAGRDPARALTYCRRAVDKSPENAAYLDSLGWAYHRLGYDEEAQKQISHALEISPHEEEIIQHALALSMNIENGESTNGEDEDYHE